MNLHPNALPDGPVPMDLEGFRALVDELVEIVPAEELAAFAVAMYLRAVARPEVPMR